MDHMTQLPAWNGQAGVELNIAQPTVQAQSPNTLMPPLGSQALVTRLGVNSLHFISLKTLKSICSISMWDLLEFGIKSHPFALSCASITKFDPFSLFLTPSIQLSWCKNDVVLCLRGKSTLCVVPWGTRRISRFICIL